VNLSAINLDKFNRVFNIEDNMRWNTISCKINLFYGMDSNLISNFSKWKIFAFIILIFGSLVLPLNYQNIEAVEKCSFVEDVACDIVGGGTSAGCYFLTCVADAPIAPATCPPGFFICPGAGKVADEGCEKLICSSSGPDYSPSFPTYPEETSTTCSDCVFNEEERVIGYGPDVCVGECTLPEHTVTGSPLQEQPEGAVSGQPEGAVSGQCNGECTFPEHTVWGNVPSTSTSGGSSSSSAPAGGSGGGGFGGGSSSSSAPAGGSGGGGFGGGGFGGGTSSSSGSSGGSDDKNGSEGNCKKDKNCAKDVAE
jgi:hypothetical protein